MSSESVIIVGETTVAVVVAVTVVLVVVVRVVNDCRTAIVTVAVLQTGLRLLSFKAEELSQIR